MFPLSTGFGLYKLNPFGSLPAQSSGYRGSSYDCLKSNFLYSYLRSSKEIGKFLPDYPSHWKHGIVSLQGVACCFELAKGSVRLIADPDRLFFFY